MRFIIVRHGETEHNKDDAITGQLDVSLNETGTSQAEKVADRLESLNFDRAYSSDLERTYETTKIIAERHGLHPERYKDLRERGFGEYEGRPKDDWREKVRDHEGDRYSLKPENGESLEEVGERFVNRLEKIADNHESSELVLVGGHSVAIKAALMKVLGLDGAGYGKLDLGNTGLTELEYNEESGWKMIRVNDVAHLKYE